MDLNNDGKLDIITGEVTKQLQRDGLLYYFTGNGDGTVTFSKTFGNIDITSDWNVVNNIGYLAHAEIFDFNNDGLLDMYIGANHKYKLPLQRDIYFFPNTGTAANPVFSDATRSAVKTTSGKTIAYIGQEMEYDDLDGDGVKDLIVTTGYKTGTTTSGDNQAFYKNSGTDNNPKYDDPVMLNIPRGLVSGTNNHVALADVDGDGDKDVLLSGSTNNLVVAYNNESTSISKIEGSTSSIGTINLSKNQLILEGFKAETAEITIFSLSGKKLLERKASIKKGNNLIDLKKLRSRAMVVRIKGSDYTYNRKIVR